jgi:hypothetical protein
MKRDNRISDRELEALVERGRTIRRLPDVVRARALARARATEAAAAADSPPAAAAAATAPAHVGTRRIAIAASMALLVGAGGAVAALVGHAPARRDAAAVSSPRAVAPTRISVPQPALPSSLVSEELIPPAKARHPARSLTPKESYAAELDLLQRAQVAFAGRDFSGALVLVAGHARRFPNGRLAEEREALRVRSLAGSGRADDARSAVAAFANRFPRSVLLPRLRQSAGAPE